MESLMKINDPILLALIATGFTWFMTALGAAMVFFFKEINKRVLNMMLGFAAGIMVAASFWVAFGSCHRNGGKKQFACLACCCYWFFEWCCFFVAGG